MASFGIVCTSDEADARILKIHCVNQCLDCRLMLDRLLFKRWIYKNGRSLLSSTGDALSPNYAYKGSTMLRNFSGKLWAWSLMTNEIWKSIVMQHWKIITSFTVLEMCFGTFKLCFISKHFALCHSKVHPAYKQRDTLLKIYLYLNVCFYATTGMIWILCLEQCDDKLVRLRLLTSFTIYTITRCWFLWFRKSWCSFLRCRYSL